MNAHILSKRDENEEYKDVITGQNYYLKLSYLIIVKLEWREQLRSILLAKNTKTGPQLMNKHGKKLVNDMNLPCRTCL